MRPRQTIEWALRFSSPVSAAWLIPAILALAVLAWLLYRNQLTGLRRWQAIGLLTLRTAILAALVFLAFKPSLIMRRILTYPGRILLLLDDSRSMLASDTAMPDTDALRLARRLGRLEESPQSAFDDAAREVTEAVALMRAFETYSRTASRRADDFWDRAAQARGQIEPVLQRLADGRPDAPGLNTDTPGRLAPAAAAARELAQELDRFFGTGHDPGTQAYLDFYRAMDDLAQTLTAIQAVADTAALADGHDELREAAENVRRTTRIDLMSEALLFFRPQLLERTPGQAIQTVSLTTGQRGGLEAFRAATLSAEGDSSDLTGRVKDLLIEASEFPLSAVILVSDGRNLGREPLRNVTAEALARQVPVYTAGIGSEREPYDLAVIGVQAPPFAVIGEPVRVRVDLRNSMPTSTVVRIRLTAGDRELTHESRTLDPGRALIEMTFTPDTAGLTVYTVILDAVPGELFPEANNRMDFVTHVRDDPAWVLLLDERPRWETRFAHNILQRLPFVTLNPIVAMVQEDGIVQRGQQRGAWPENQESLNRYDVVIMGTPAFDLLSNAERDALDHWVTQRGGTLAVIADRDRASDPEGHGIAADAPLETLAMTPVGSAHALTRALADTIWRHDGDTVGERVTDDGQVLAVIGHAESPLLAVRFDAAGNRLTLLDDELWRWLNPGALAAHTELVVNLLVWALEGGFAADGSSEEPALALDARRFPPGAPVQVWLRPDPQAGIVEALRDGSVWASAPARPVQGAGNLARAVFTNVPPGNIVFRLQARPEIETPWVRIGADNRELAVLARDPVFLRALAAGTGARTVDLEDLETCFHTIPPRDRVETEERIWRLWGLRSLLALLALAISGQWIWRKWIGLV